MPYKDPEKRREASRHWSKENKEKVLRSKRKWNEKNPSYFADRYEKNKDKILAQQATKYRDDPQKFIDKSKKWREDNPEKFNKANREDKRRRRQDVNYKLAANLRTRLYHAIIGDFKSGSAIRDLGCSIPELKTYLENQFQFGMSWDNYGEWHIDHILPISSFDLTDREQFLKVCHYTNLQPLWGPENIKKGSKV